MDTLTVYKQLAAAGIPSGHADAMAQVTAQAISDALATKADLALLESKLNELRSDLRREIADAKSSLLMWMFGIAAGQLGLLVAFLKLFPGGGS